MANAWLPSKNASFLPVSGSVTGKRFELRRRVIVTGARHADVLGDHRVAFPFELQAEYLFENFEFDADQPQHCGQGNRILHQVASDRRRQFLHREAAKLNPGRGAVRFDLVLVVKHGRARRHQAEMAIHGILIERD